MTDTKPSAYPHLQDSVAELANSSDDVRIRAIQAGIWVTYQRAKEILNGMEDLFNHPPIDRMSHMLIVGPSNNGKTQILKHFLEQHPTDPNPEGEAIIAPVVMVSAPPTPDISDLCTRILSKLNSPFREIGKASERIRSVKLVLERTGTRMLLIDEIQHMLSGGATKQREFRNAIKDLGNELELSIVAAGIDDAYTVFATDPQLSNRFLPEPLPLWKMDKNLGRLLDTIERKVPLRKPSGLKSPELLQQIYFMSEGTIGEIYAVIKLAAILAIKTGSEQITLETLRGIRWTQPSKRKERTAFK